MLRMANTNTGGIADVRGTYCCDWQPDGVALSEGWADFLSLTFWETRDNETVTGSPPIYGVVPSVYFPAQYLDTRYDSARRSTFELPAPNRGGSPIAANPGYKREVLPGGGFTYAWVEQSIALPGAVLGSPEDRARVKSGVSYPRTIQEQAGRMIPNVGTFLWNMYDQRASFKKRYQPRSIIPTAFDDQVAFPRELMIRAWTMGGRDFKVCAYGTCNIRTFSDAIAITWFNEYWSIMVGGSTYEPILSRVHSTRYTCGVESVSRP